MVEVEYDDHTLPIRIRVFNDDPIPATEVHKTFVPDVETEHDDKE